MKSVSMLKLFVAIPRYRSTVIKRICFTVVILCSVGIIEGQNSVMLPFVDDFSSYTGNPKPSLWQNAGALVNTGYAYLPPTTGVVTLDILDADGMIYSHANVYGFAADTLTTVSIRMDSISEPVTKRLAVSDSIWLSFFIQPGGSMGNLWERIGSAPSSKDSIVLQFYKSNQDVWQTVWSRKGSPLDSIYKNDSVYFLQVMIPITDTAYFNRDFRFRFINYGSLDNNPSYSYISNKGQWNIDYVYMDINRRYNTPTTRDIAFVNPAASLLKNFTSIPAKHFTKNYMKDTVYNTIVNLYSSTLNSNYSFNVTQPDGSVVYTYSGGFENIVSYPSTHEFQSAANHVSHHLDFAYNPPQNQFSEYIVTHIVKEGVGQDNIQSNDTVRFVQKFENYISYDDGSAESGIGIEPSKASELAVRYPLLATDTLYAVDIYFNCTYQQSNLQPFYLNIYDAVQEISSYKDNDGNEINDTVYVPNEPLYQSERLTPEYDGLNKYHRYYLDEPLVLPQGEFFVTLKPVKSAYMNIGFDQNNDAVGFMYEKRSNQWSEIFLKGAPMIRPYFGYLSVGIDDTVSGGGEIKIYPNPANDYVYIDYYGNVEVRLFDQSGRELIRTKSKMINVSSLQTGIYFLRVNNKTEKLIIAR